MRRIAGVIGFVCIIWQAVVATIMATQIVVERWTGAEDSTLRTLYLVLLMAVTQLVANGLIAWAKNE